MPHGEPVKVAIWWPPPATGGRLVETERSGDQLEGGAVSYDLISGLRYFFGVFVLFS